MKLGNSYFATDRLATNSRPHEFLESGVSFLGPEAAEQATILNRTKDFCENLHCYSI